jgi:hypothetical protein
VSFQHAIYFHNPSEFTLKGGVDLAIVAIVLPIIAIVSGLANIALAAAFALRPLKRGCRVTGAPAREHWRTPSHC